MIKYSVSFLIGGFPESRKKMNQKTVMIKLNEEQCKMIDEVREQCAIDFGCKMILQAMVCGEKVNDL